ncbi:hypothetical protein HNO82_04330 [Herbaspirillum sp. C9C3]|nr:hypothetical protein [Herbaspirillum sp. C9C3]
MLNQNTEERSVSRSSFSIRKQAFRLCHQIKKAVAHCPPPEKMYLLIFDLPAFYALSEKNLAQRNIKNQNKYTKNHLLQPTLLESQIPVFSKRLGS